MTNHLTIAALDPESNEPNYKQCAIRLVAAEPVEADPAGEPIPPTDAEAPHAALHDGGVPGSVGGGSGVGE